MGHILDYINNNNESGFHCYKTRKISLDEIDIDAVSSENSDTDTIPVDTSGKIAEDNQKRVNTIEISRTLIENTPPLLQEKYPQVAITLAPTKAA